MTVHPQLPGLTTPPRLTERQAFALSVIREFGPVASDVLGRWMHDRRGKHGVLTSCTYCPDEGRSVALELRRKGLVKQRRGHGWIAVGHRQPRREVETGNEIPF